MGMDKNLCCYGDTDYMATLIAQTCGLTVQFLSTCFLSMQFYGTLNLYMVFPPAVELETWCPMWPKLPSLSHCPCHSLPNTAYGHSFFSVQNASSVSLFWEVFSLVCWLLYNYVHIQPYFDVLSPPMILPPGLSGSL